MKINFDVVSTKLVEFGVGRDDGKNQTFVAIPVDSFVQKSLKEMVAQTWTAMQAENETPLLYEPSEKHAGIEHLYLPVASEMAKGVLELHNAQNLTIDSAALKQSENVFSYFVRMTDQKNSRLTAVRRANQFKGILKSKGKIVRMLDDTLQVVSDTVFKLDSDFDFLIDSENVHILHPSGFEFAGKLQQEILKAVPGNIKALRSELKYIDLDGIEKYASNHPRAARYIASIRGQKKLKNIDKTALKQLCKHTGVEISEVGEKMHIAPGSEMGFLEVLDRRRYELELVIGQPEKFRAASRQKIQ